MVSAWVKSSKPILVKKFQSEFEIHFGEDFFLTESENTWLPRLFFIMKFEIWSHFHFNMAPLPGDVEQQEGLILITYSLMVYACDAVWNKKCRGSSQMDASFSTSCWGGIINAWFYSEKRKKRRRPNSCRRRRLKLFDYTTLAFLLFLLVFAHYTTM